MQLTFVGACSKIASCAREAPAGYVIRSLDQGDEAALASLYYSAYSKEIVADLEAAVQEMELTFAGEYGRLATDLSCVTVTQGVLVSAIMTVEQAPWPDTPVGPFVIEVVTNPNHRRLGLAQAGLTWVALEASKRSLNTLGLRVDSNNHGAVVLYRRMGFTDWRL